MKIDLDALFHFEPAPPPRPILPTIALGLDEVFCYAPHHCDFMPVLEVALVRRDDGPRSSATFSLS